MPRGARLMFMEVFVGVPGAGGLSRTLVCSSAFFFCLLSEFFLFFYLLLWAAPMAVPPVCIL